MFKALTAHANAPSKKENIFRFGREFVLGIRLWGVICLREEIRLLVFGGNRLSAGGNLSLWALF